MREEIEAAVHFMGRVISASNSSIDNVSKFTSCLFKVLEGRFQGHWHADIPGKGQGYRSIRIHPTEPLDPVLEEAARECNFNHSYFIIPVEFTLWVDPKDVSCRFGDLKATYCTVLKNEDNKASTIDVEELLETAKALYNRQQRITIQHNAQHEIPYSYSAGNESYGYGPSPLSGSPPNGFHMYGYVEGYLPPNFMMFPPRFGEDLSTPPSPHYQPSFLSSAVNTTPRKSSKSGHFRKGPNGSGRGPKHHQTGDGATYNHNHNNNHNSSGSSPSTNSTGINWGDRFHWIKGSKNHHPQQQQQSSGPGKETK